MEGGTKRAHARCIQDLIKRDIVPPRDSGPGVFHLKTLHRYSVGLRSNPAHTALGDALSTALLDRPLQRVLEESGSLNWCATEAPLYALKGVEREDGLLDAVAVSMWGVPDTDLSLRTALYNTAARGPPTELRPEGHREWTAEGQSQPGGEAWDHVVRLLEPRTRDEPPGDNAYLHVHLFLLANVIRRAIVVLSGSAEHTKTAAAGWASNQGPAGVYLPLLWDSADCYPYPVVLGSVSPWRRFAPLVPGSVHCGGVPLAWRPPGETPRALPLRFRPDGDEKHWLRTYLHAADSHLDGCAVQTARLNTLQLPEHLILEQCCVQVCPQEGQVSEGPQSPCREVHRPPPSSSSRMLPVATETCRFSPSTSTWPRCRRCAVPQRPGGKCDKGRLPQCMLGADRPEGRGYLSVEHSASGPPSRPQLPAGPRSAPSHLLRYSRTHNAERPRSPPWSDRAQKPPTGLKQVPLSGVATETSDFLCGRCVSCKLETRTFNGLCFRCLQSRTAPPPGAHTAPVPPLELAPPRHPPVGALSTERCRTPHCIYFGTPKRSGYCSLCYCSQDAVQAASPLPTPALQLSSTLRGLPRCSGPGCHMLGTPSFRGLCERCHLSSRQTAISVPQRHLQASRGTHQRCDTLGVSRRAEQSHSRCGFESPH